MHTFIYTFYWKCFGAYSIDWKYRGSIENATWTMCVLLQIHVTEWSTVPDRSSLWYDRFNNFMLKTCSVHVWPTIRVAEAPGNSHLWKYITWRCVLTSSKTGWLIMYPVISQSLMQRREWCCLVYQWNAALVAEHLWTLSTPLCSSLSRICPDSPEHFQLRYFHAHSEAYINFLYCETDAK